MFRLQCGESRFEVRRVHFDCWQTNTEGCVLCRRWVAHLDIVQEASSLTGTTNHSPGIAKIADSWRNQSMRFAGRLWSSINSEDPGGPLSVEKQVGDIWRCLFSMTWTYLDQVDSCSLHRTVWAIAGANAQLYRGGRKLSSELFCFASDLEQLIPAWPYRIDMLMAHHFSSG